MSDNNPSPATLSAAIKGAASGLPAVSKALHALSCELRNPGNRKGLRETLRSTTRLVDALLVRLAKAEATIEEQGDILAAAEIDDSNDQDLLIHFLRLCASKDGTMTPNQDAVFNVLRQFLILNYNDLFVNGELDENFRHSNHWLFHNNPAHGRTWKDFIDAAKAHVSVSGVPEEFNGMNKDAKKLVVTAAGNHVWLPFTM